MCAPRQVGQPRWRRIARRCALFVLLAALGVACSLLVESGPSSPNFSFSDGNPAHGIVLLPGPVDGYYPGIPGYPDSNWRVDQWHKTELLYPGQWTAVASPMRWVWTSGPKGLSVLRVLPQSDGSLIFDIFGQDGPRSKAGGTNLYLSAETKTTFGAEPLTMNRPVRYYVTGNIPGSHYKLTTSDPSLTSAVRWTAYSSLVFTYVGPSTGYPCQSQGPCAIFLQIWHGRFDGNAHRPRYINTGDLSLLNYAYLLPSDPAFVPAAQPYVFDANAYLCDAVTHMASVLPPDATNLAKWNIVAISVGIETSNHWQGKAAGGTAWVELEVSKIDVIKDSAHSWTSAACPTTPPS